MALISYVSRDAWSFSTTVWFPAALVLAALIYTPPCDWPLWLVSAGCLHMLSGLWIDRPPLLAAIFAIFDLLVLPLCVVALRIRPRLLPHAFCRDPVIGTLIDALLLTFCTCTGSALLGFCLMLAGYPVAQPHFTSWALAALTAMLAVLPLLRAAPKPFSQRDDGIIVLNVVLLLALYAAPVDYGHYASELLWFQYSCLILSALALSFRATAFLLLLHYGIVILATLTGYGLFYRSSQPPCCMAIWQAQNYLVFSCLTVTCLAQFIASQRQRLAHAASEQDVLRCFSHVGSCHLFTLTMPDGELHWSGSPGLFFPQKKFPVSTLELLEAHCEAPFLAEFHHWHAGTKATPFQQTLTLWQLSGTRIPCLLIIQQVPGQAQLVGGMAKLQEPCC
ncbi:hypothetical protein [Mixta mediterraneensis]|uniref:hypothetical protein n=1 Tax=Mixta mediterraneensis TaxID=2758443 RepID=UPI001875A6F7|nr:hypothetical protein [Mixta mediterraneensis]